jgi:hypothetical protein
MEKLFENALGLVPPLILAVVTSLITVQLSLRRFYAERWWDRKADAYTSIFETLYRLKNYSDEKFDEDFGLKELSDEQKNALQKQWRDADFEISKAVEIGSFNICREAVDCLKEFQSKPRLSLEDNPIHELAGQESKYLRDCIIALRKIALKDLKLKHR